MSVLKIISGVVSLISGAFEMFKQSKRDAELKEKFNLEKEVEISRENAETAKQEYAAKKEADDIEKCIDTLAETSDVNAVVEEKKKALKNNEDFQKGKTITFEG